MKTNLNPIEARVLGRLINGVNLKIDSNGVRWLKRSLIPRGIGGKSSEITKAIEFVKKQGFVKSMAKDALKKGPRAEYFSVTPEGVVAHAQYMNSLWG